MGRSNKRESFPDCNRPVRQAIQRLWATVRRAKSTNSIWRVLSKKSWPDLGMSIPSVAGQTGHKMPLKPRAKLRPEGRSLWDNDYCPPSSPTGIQLWASVVTDLNYRSGWIQWIQGEDQREKFCTLGKLTELASGIIWHFRVKILWPQFPASSHTWKSTKTINSDVCFQMKSNNLPERCVLDCTHRILKSQTYWPPLPSPPLFGTVLRAF